MEYNQFNRTYGVKFINGSHVNGISSNHIRTSSRNKGKGKTLVVHDVDAIQSSTSWDGGSTASSEEFNLTPKGGDIFKQENNNLIPKVGDILALSTEWDGIVLPCKVIKGIRQLIYLLYL